MADVLMTQQVMTLFFILRAVEFYKQYDFLECNF